MMDVRTNQRLLQIESKTAGNLGCQPGTGKKSLT
jgi:hypothetical protein